MNTKFVKGILLMLSILIAALQGESIVWAATIISMICVGSAYYVKNYLMSSTSQEGVLNLRDILSGLILAIVAAVGDSISSLVINGIVDWGAMYKMCIGVVIAYFSTTFFSGQKANA